jgi:uncharacterized membrane protein YcaP (DUF421 family)
MEFLWKTDWARLFVPEMSLPEILIRGVLIYVALCLLLRVVLKRQAGKVSLSDLLVVTIVAGVCRNPLVRDAYSITDGVLVVATVLFTGYARDWLSYYVPWIHALLHAPPVPLIHDGVILHDNLRRELMTESRLRCKLRGKGVRDPAEVADAWLEGEGKVSVIKKETPPPRPPSAAGNGFHRTDAPRAAEAAVCPGPGDGGDGDDIGAFLDVARRLREKIARHQRCIDEHQQAIDDVKEMLKRYGFHLKPFMEAGPTDESPGPPPHHAERP